MNLFLEALMRKITSTYSNQIYQNLTGDTYFNNVPHALWILWYSDGSHRFALCNMQYYYNKYREGVISEAEFGTKLKDLDAAFAHEFEYIYKANSEERRKPK